MSSKCSKQELLRLSKKALIKQCKKYNIQIFHKETKNAMVNKILQKRKIKKKKKKSKQNKQATKSIDTKRKKIVNGFIREIKLSYIIPDDITIYILSYISTHEYFAVLGIDCVIVDKYKRNIMKHIKTGWSNTSYGKIQVPSLSKVICRWTFKIIEPTKSSLGIGICSSNALINKQFYIENGNNDQRFWYVYTGHRDAKWGEGQKISHNRFGNTYYGRNYGEKCEGNSIIMELNLIKNQLKYIVDGIDQGVAFKNIKTGTDIKYSLAISVYFLYKIELVEYEEFMIEKQTRKKKKKKTGKVKIPYSSSTACYNQRKRWENAPRKPNYGGFDEHFDF